MPPASKAAVTCFLCKFERTTVFLPISSATTLAILRVAFLDALTQSRPTTASPELELEPAELPASADDIAFWRSEGEADGETKWGRLKDEKSGADKWGLPEAAVLGVSFKEGGAFPPPNVVVPPVDE